MLAKRVFDVALAVSLVTLTNGQYHGILINEYIGGTQLYDPFNTPYVQGNLKLGLQSFFSAVNGAAVANEQLAYFGGADGG